MRDRVNRSSARVTGRLGFVPFIVILLVSGLAGVFSPTSPVSIGLPTGLVASSRTLILLVAYLIAAGIAWRRSSLSVKLGLAVVPLLALIVLQAASMLWVKAPITVVLNAAHQIGLLLAAISLAIYSAPDMERAVRVVHRALTLLVLASVVSVLLGLQGTIHVTGRWSGLAGNPNTLGLLCVLTLLFTMAELAYAKWRLIGGKQLWSGLAVVASVTALAGCASVTSLSLAVGSVVLFPALSILGKKPPVKRAAFILFYAVLAVIAYLLLELLMPTLASYRGALESVGRDVTFTGRQDLWVMAIDLFQYKPLLGWGFDSWQSLPLREQLGVNQFRQFHNGYLDLAVRGGALAVILLMWVLASAGLRIWRLLVYSPFEGALTGCMLAVAMISSLTEATLFRELQIIWVVFVAVYLLLVMRTAAQPRYVRSSESRQLFTSSLGVFR